MTLAHHIIDSAKHNNSFAHTVDTDETADDEPSLTGDRRQTKQFGFLDADCLVVGESQSSSRRSAGRYPVKPPRPEGDSH